MESIVTLIVIIVVFNLINSLFRAIRGGRPVPRTTLPVGADPPFEDSEESPAVYRQDDTAYFYSAFPDDDEYVADSNRKSDETVEEVSENLGKMEEQTVTLKRETVCRPSKIASGLNRALTQKDPLVSAFIFQEIFRKAPAMRRRH